MVRVLGAVADFSPPVVLAVYKLLDLLILLQPAAFNTHQWMFVFGSEHELALAGCSKPSSSPQSNRDEDSMTPAISQLSTVVATAATEPRPEAEYNAAETAAGPTSMLRPLLTVKMQKIAMKDVDELLPYAAQLRARAYDNSVSVQQIDYAFIEQYLEEEFVIWDSSLRS